MTTNITKSRNFTFTINNYSQKDLEEFHISAKSLEKHRYIVYGLEVAPKTGTKHIQGYIQLNSAQRYSFLHNYFNFKANSKVLKFHVEVAKGTPAHNKKYCKKDGDSYEYGEPISQGNRTDLSEIKELIKNNPRDINKIIDEHGNNLQQVRFAQILQPIYLSIRDLDIPPKVFWIFGASGIGKTQLVYNTFDDVCSVSSFDWLGTDYSQNECFLLDDFREGNLSFETILKLTDRYPYTVFLKGSQLPFNSPYIIFTSPNCINATFFDTNEDLTQIKRRIKEINLDDIEDINNLDLRNLEEKYLFRD